MALEAINVTCPKCSAQFTQVPKRSFLGFQKIVCPSCQNKATYPLTYGYQAVYWGLLVLMVVMMYNGFSQGEFMMPGGIGFAVIFALLRDRSLRKRLGTPALADVSNRSY